MKFVEKRLFLAEKEIVDLRKQVKAYKEKEAKWEAEKMQLANKRSKACIVC